jgi:phosphatidylglycerophosphate synthase
MSRQGVFPCWGFGSTIVCPAVLGTSGDDPYAMTEYQPSSRRPIADGFRETAHSATRWCVKHGVHPDAISYFSLVASAVAAVCFWRSGAHPWLLVVAPAFCYLRLWCNMLDGMVALAAGKASWRGEILNDLPDRVSDVLIFAGVAHSTLCSPVIAYWAAIMALLTAYVGMFGQAVGAQREFSGTMAKPWRMVTLHLGAWLAFVWRGRCDGLSVLDWTCLVVIVGCVETIAVRLARIFRALRAKEARR